MAALGSSTTSTTAAIRRRVQPSRQVTSQATEAESLPAEEGTSATIEEEVAAATSTPEEATESTGESKKETQAKITMPEDFESNPVVQFDPLPPMIGCDAEKFQELTQGLRDSLRNIRRFADEKDQERIIDMEAAREERYKKEQERLKEESSANQRK